MLIYLLYIINIIVHTNLLHSSEATVTEDWREGRDKLAVEYKRKRREVGAAFITIFVVACDDDMLCFVILCCVT